MKPVDQSKLNVTGGGHPGNCLAACIASIMDMPLWMVPPWERMWGMGQSWFERCDEWLALFGKTIVHADIVDFDTDCHYIANGYSPRMIMHSVIYLEGQLVHDPHPSRAGIIAVDHIYKIVARTEPARELAHAEQEKRE